MHPIDFIKDILFRKATFFCYISFALQRLPAFSDQFCLIQMAYL